MRGVGLCVAIFGLVLLGSSVPAFAHMGAKGVVKERMDAMSAMGKTMKSLNDMARGKTAYDGAAVARAGRLMKGHADHMPMLFPKGTNAPPSEAKAEIWADWTGFRKLAADLAAESGTLAEIGANGDQRALARQFGRVGKTCSGCHKAFRAKKSGR